MDDQAKGKSHTDRQNELRRCPRWRIESGYSIGWDFTACLFIAALIGCEGSIKYDEASATKTALQFGRDAFVNQDSESAYALLSDSAKRYVTPETFKESLSKWHPKGFPTEVTVSEYQPVPGEKLIHVYLSGETPGGRLNYQLTMEGDAATGYRVASFERGGQPPPWSSTRQKPN